MKIKNKFRYESRIPFFLVWKFLRHGNKWTFFLIVFLMSVSFVNLVFINSLFNGIIKSSNDQIINTYTGNIMLAPKEGQEFFTDTNSIMSKIDNVSGIEGKSSQLIIPANLKYKNKKGNWQILAIDPEAEKSVTNISEKMIEGSYLSADDNDGIIIGRQIAGGKDVEMNAFSFKGAKVGDKVTLAFDSISKDYTIRGIFYTKFINTDQRAFVTKKSVEKLNTLFKDKTNNIILKISKNASEKKVINELKEEGIDANFYTWNEVAGLMTTVAKSFLSINVLMTVVGIIIAAVTIFIVVYVDISNKKQEIGILRAIGIKPYIIRTNYVLQTVIYSCLGVIVGTGIFYAILVPYFQHRPFELPIGDVILAVDYFDLVIRGEAVILVGILSGLIPGFMVTRIKLLDAIWGR